MKRISIAQLHRIAGYVQCGEGEAVTYSQDECTKTWCVRVGTERFFSDSLGDAFDMALASANKHYADVYDMKVAK